MWPFLFAFTSPLELKHSAFFHYNDFARFRSGFCTNKPKPELCMKFFSVNYPLACSSTWTLFFPNNRAFLQFDFTCSVLNQKMRRGMVNLTL